MSDRALSVRSPVERMAGSGMPLFLDYFLTSDERYLGLDSDGRHGVNDQYSIELFQSDNRVFDCRSG